MDVDEIKKNSRYIPVGVKKAVLEKQGFKCANNPFVKQLIMQGYECLLWRFNGGSFDEAGYEFDHIDEYSITFNNNVSNIQALCPNCHSVKTKNFMKNKGLFTSSEMNAGASLMEF